MSRSTSRRSGALDALGVVDTIRTDVVREHRRQRRSDTTSEQFYEEFAISPHQRDVQTVDIAPGLTLTHSRLVTSTEP